MASRGTQRSNISLTKVQPLIDNEFLELISNPGSGQGSRNISPTPPLGDEIQPFKSMENGFLNVAGDVHVNVAESDCLTALQRAIRLDDVAAVIYLLDNGADINLSDQKGFTPLHAAVRFERTEIAKLLLERGADPLKEDENLLTPLHSAARRGFTEICRLLMREKSVNANIVNRRNISPLHLACWSGNRETCELFLENGADITTTAAVSRHPPLHFAAWKGHENICELFITTDYEGKSALHYACSRGHPGVVDLLLRHDADCDAADRVNGTSPLHLAAKHGHVTLVQLLILYGAVIESRTGCLKTPLHSAAAFNHGRIVELLLENGADPEAKDVLSMTPFLFAVTLGAIESANMLLDHGADITARDSFLNSCLHLAVNYRRPETVKMLLERGRDKVSHLTDKDLRTVFHLAAGLEDSVILEILMDEINEKDILNMRDVNENTPLHIAAKNGSLGCVEHFSDCPYLLNEREERGFTALHLAASNGHSKTCELLISKGSDVTNTDGDGSTPLHLAVKAGSLKTVKVLLGNLLPNTLEQKDYDKNTPLHVACMHNRRDIVKFLLDKGADVTARNERNMTCLDVAIEWEAGEVAKTLIRHQRWEEVLKYSPSQDVSPMQQLIEKLPNVAEIVLDQCISYSPLPPSHEDFSVTFNFIPLDPDVDAEFDKYFGPASMAIHRRERLLNHTVTQALLRWKWMILGKCVTIFNTAAFAIFVILFTCLVVTERDKLKSSFLSSEITTEEEERESVIAKTVPYVILVSLCLQLIKELFQLAVLRLSYFKDLTNYLELLMFGSVWIFIFPYISGTDLFSVKTQWIAGIVGLLLCYFNFTLSLRRFGGLGLYVTMYVEVLFTFVKVMSTFIITLTGFSLAFYLLLKEQSNFSGFWLALAKIYMMMAGELEYTDTLVDNIALNRTVPGTDMPYVPFPILTFFLFLMFVLMVSVVLVNLLVGLAVGDIETIRKTASLRALIDQVLLVNDILKSYPRFILKRIHKSSLEIKPNQNSFCKRWEEVLKYSPSQDVSPMQQLIEKLPNVAEIVLDQCISYSPLPPSHEDFSVTFNFIPLDPDVDAEFDKYFGPASMAIHRRERLLNHTVTQALLRWKWMILGKCVTIFNTAAFAIFVILFTCLVVTERDKLKSSFLSSEITTEEEERESVIAKTVPYVILVSLCLQLIKELFQLAVLRLSYFKDLTNYLELLMFGSVWIFIFPYISGTDLFSVKTQWIAGIVGLLLCYFNFTLSLRRFGGLGLYVTMYVEVLFTFVKVMSTFIITLTGFSLAFYLLLKEQSNFSGFWLALAKIYMMMAGELEYTDTLVDNIALNRTVPGTDMPYVPFPILTFFLFLMFVLMVSVVLVNLLVGLAVGDIETIRKTASLRALIDQVLLVNDILKSYPRFILKRIHKSSLEIKPNQNSFCKRVALAGSDFTDWDFMDNMLCSDSGTTSTEEVCIEKQMQDEIQEERIQKLQAAVEAQDKLLQGMADRLKIAADHQEAQGRLIRAMADRLKIEVKDR